MARQTARQTNTAATAAAAKAAETRQAQEAETKRVSEERQAKAAEARKHQVPMGQGQVIGPHDFDGTTPEEIRKMAITTTITTQPLGPGQVTGGAGINSRTANNDAPASQDDEASRSAGL